MPNNNNNAYVEINNAAAQMTGDDALATVNLQGIVDVGKQWTAIQKEQWANALSAAYMSTKYTDREYNDKYNDVFYEDAATFGAITRIINIEMPDVIASRNWETITSGTTTIGSNVVYLPIIKEQLYASSASWSVPIAFTGTQLNEAFDSVSGLLEFDAYVRLMAETSVKYHRAVMNSMNRNNYMAEKINAGNSTGKINVVNLVKEYADYTGAATMTKQAFLANPAGLRYAQRVFKKYKGLLTDMTTLFTTDATSKGKFVADDRLVFQVLADFEGLMTSEVYSNTYHDEFVKMPLYRTVNAWQGLTGSAASADFDTLSAINATTASGNNVTYAGIVGMMVDKWAIMHTIIQNRVGVQRDDIKDITLNDYQFTDKYINNLTLPGVVFVVADVT